MGCYRMRVEDPSSQEQVPRWQTIYSRDVIFSLAVLWPAQFRRLDSAVCDP
jgi:hypothetical protein